MAIDAQQRAAGRPKRRKLLRDRSADWPRRSARTPLSATERANAVASGDSPRPRPSRRRKSRRRWRKSPRRSSGPPASRSLESSPIWQRGRSPSPRRCGADSWEGSRRWPSPRAGCIWPKRRGRSRTQPWTTDPSRPSSAMSPPPDRCSPWARSWAGERPPPKVRVVRRGRSGPPERHAGGERSGLPGQRGGRHGPRPARGTGGGDRGDHRPQGPGRGGVDVRPEDRRAVEKAARRIVAYLRWRATNREGRAAAFLRPPIEVLEEHVGGSLEGRWPWRSVPSFKR